MFPQSNLPTGFAQFAQGKRPTTILFNRLNGMFITTLSIPIEECEADEDVYIRVECPGGFDSGKDIIVGGLTIHEDGSYTPNFEIKDQHEVMSRRITESQMDTNCAYKITKRYPIVKQLNVLSEALTKLATHAGVELDDLAEMLDYIKQCRTTNQTKKDFYAESPDWDYVTNEQNAEDQALRLEGGIHEKIGPRPITGGSVFGGDR